MDHSPLWVPTGELILGALATVTYAAFLLAIAATAYRRSRCLSEYPVWQSVLIAVLAASFPGIWLVASFVNRDRLRDEWHRYNSRRETPHLAPTG
ncbi:hypothetical protein [Aeromicrobium sp. UC242_57]|uniref:hypothetical protein n=1 Tax=Aeromicrobium sp. UC242_57 TaxID=3374624 RepID=UPI00378CD652